MQQPLINARTLTQLPPIFRGSTGSLIRKDCERICLEVNNALALTSFYSKCKVPLYF